jgi:hypothetical protein
MKIRAASPFDECIKVGGWAWRKNSIAASLSHHKREKPIRSIDLA